jgi:hypothetical protein
MDHAAHPCGHLVFRSRRAWVGAALPSMLCVDRRHGGSTRVWVSARHFGRLGCSMRARLVVAAVAAVTAASLVAVPASARQAPTYVKAPVAVGTGGAVASGEFNASKAGIDVLRSGGNAIDAAVAVAVAVASTLGVTKPFVAGPGGGGFMVIYLARAHQVVTIEGREMCPAACTPQLFIAPATGKPLAFEEPATPGCRWACRAWSPPGRRRCTGTAYTASLTTCSRGFGGRRGRAGCGR